MLLKDKKAIVTGASRGIGRSIAKEFIEQGAIVAVTYKTNKEMAEEVVATDPRGASFSVPLNVCDRNSIREARNLINNLFCEKIDVLVNNAGINKPNDFHLINDEEWNEVLSTNLAGPFRVTQEFLSLMSRKGSIVNIASVSGQYGGPRTTHYAASKAGLIALTQNMAIFFASSGVRVNTVSPGLIESEMVTAAKNLGIEEKILLKRLGKPEEVAKTVVFLASDYSSYITAQTINVNGGLYF